VHAAGDFEGETVFVGDFQLDPDRQAQVKKGPIPKHTVIKAINKAKAPVDEESAAD